jgi:hypothetical protein
MDIITLYTGLENFSMYPHYPQAVFKVTSALTHMIAALRKSSLPTSYQYLIIKCQCDT